MMPWSIGWTTLVVFGGKQASSTLENFIWGWLLRYPRTTKHAGFAFSFYHWKPLTIPPWSVTSFMPFCWISTQREVSVCPVFGSIVVLLPCRSLKGFSISPDIKPHRKTVNLSLQSFPPEYFSPFGHNDLFGSARKNSPVSSFSH